MSAGQSRHLTDMRKTYYKIIIKKKSSNTSRNREETRKVLKFLDSQTSGRLEEIDTRANASGTQLLFREYAFTRAGDIKWIKTRRGEAPEVVFSYTYDPLHRLKAEESEGIHPSLEYDYDPVGNILFKSSGNSAMDYEYDPLHPHRVWKVRGTFPKEIPFAERSIQYDAESMPVKIEDTLNSGSMVATYFFYDGEGAIAAKVSDSEFTL